MKLYNGRKMDGTGDHQVKQNKPDSERQTSCFLSYSKTRPIKNDINVRGGLYLGETRGRVKGLIIAKYTCMK
jgi:hypothetical protein